MVNPAATQRDKKPGVFARFIAWMLRHAQQSVGSLGDLWRTPFTSVMTILVLGISLSLPASLNLFVKNAERVSSQWESASEISLFLKLSVTDRAAQNLVNRIQLMPEVDSVVFISKEQALEDFKQHSGFGGVLEYLASNPLPATILVTPTQRFSQASAAQELLTKLEGIREVEKGKLDLAWLSRLEAMAKLIEDVVIGVATLLCLSVILIVSNTIRLQILNQKDAIAVMKLVGATDGFIQRPYLYAGLWYGIIGGLVACLAVEGLRAFLSSAIAHLSAQYDSNFELAGMTLQEISWLILFAIILGWVGSYLSVRKHIREIEPTAE
ncbi:permease-like cell division protein FtsX [Thalassotalea agarivorans]|uniref:Cell division protein FtsX n=1 Tax=Thalassotalea agarivorans TaxID=349064 RepID=A0A1I0EAU4_THASX|nr:permease-like cell division protein FtsX [Thalassotalea agarivorans]SET42176.1 cell division protein FtsX [Thalassotalea agarivorans]